MANDSGGSTHCYGPKPKDGPRPEYLKLPGVAALAGYPTPNTPSGGPNIKSTERHTGGMDLEGVATLALSGWATASSRDWKDTPGMATTGTNPDGSTRQRTDQLPRQAAQAIGTPMRSSNSETEKRGALNPALSRWLMGYPAAWDSCGATAMQSFLKSRRNSSKQ
jgi:hypothetical protein